MSTLHVPVKPEILKMVDANFAEEAKIKIEHQGKVKLCEGLHQRDTEHLIFFESEPIAVPCYNCDHLMIIDEVRFNEWKKSQGVVA